MKSIRLYRHPDCMRCAAFARWHKRLDWLNRFEDSVGTAPTGPLALGEIAVQDLRTGDTLKGIACFRLLCRQIPLYWLLLPLTYLPPVRRSIERDIQGCAGQACAVPGSEGTSRPARKR